MYIHSVNTEEEHKIELAQTGSVDSKHSSCDFLG